MKYKIINYFFTYKNKTYWFTKFEEALSTYALFNKDLKVARDDVIFHIVKEYDTDTTENDGA